MPTWSCTTYSGSGAGRRARGSGASSLVGLSGGWPDGNLTTSTASASALAGLGRRGPGTGQKPNVGFVPKPETIDFAVDNCGRMPLVVTGSTDVAPPTSTTVDAGGVAYLVTEQRRRLVNDVVEHAFLQDIAGMGVWPGQVIQGKSLLVGDVAPIGPLPRRPGTIDVVTDVITNTPSGQSARVADPNSATVNQARRDMVRALTRRTHLGC